MSGENLEQVKVAFIAKNGQTVYLEGNVNCKFASSRPVAIRGIFHNISQRVAIEAALQHQQEEKQQARISVLSSHTLQPQIEGTDTDLINVTVLCADIVGLSEIAAVISAMELVNLLSPIFATFDRLSTRYGLEKIHSINDAYVVISGLPTKNKNHAQAIAQMALDMQAAIAAFNQENQQNLKLCIGIHTGVVTTAAIGLKDIINVARCVEAQSLANTIQVTSPAYEQIRDEFLLYKQDEVAITSQYKIRTYVLVGKKGSRKL
jgi:class 3 adenylate cyclase